MAIVQVQLEGRRNEPVIGWKMIGDTLAEQTMTRSDRFAEIQALGLALNRRIAAELGNWEDDGWRGDIEVVRRCLGHLAERPELAAAAAVRGGWMGQIHKRLMRLAAVRTRILHECLQAEGADEPLVFKGMPCGLVLGLAAAGFARTLRGGDRSAHLHPAFTAMRDGEVEAGLAALTAQRRWNDREWWPCFEVVIAGRPIALTQFCGLLYIEWDRFDDDGRPKAIDRLVYAHGDGPCFFQSGEVDYADCISSR